MAEIQEHDNGCGKGYAVGLSVADRREIYEEGHITIDHPAKGKKYLCIYVGGDRYDSPDPEATDGCHIRPYVDYPEMTNGFPGRKWGGRSLWLYWQSQILTGQEPVEDSDHMEALLDISEPTSRDRVERNV